MVKRECFLKKKLKSILYNFPIFAFNVLQKYKHS